MMNGKPKMHTGAQQATMKGVGGMHRPMPRPKPPSLGSSVTGKPGMPALPGKRPMPAGAPPMQVQPMMPGGVGVMPLMVRPPMPGGGVLPQPLPVMPQQPVLRAPMPMQPGMRLPMPVNMMQPGMGGARSLMEQLAAFRMMAGR